MLETPSPSAYNVRGPGDRPLTHILKLKHNQNENNPFPWQEIQISFTQMPRLLAAIPSPALNI